MIEIRLLGPIVVETDQGPVQVSSTLEQALLARLAFAPGHAIGREHLITDLWGESLPRNGAASLQSLVYRLRGSLGNAGRAVVLRAGGYSLDVPPGQVDVPRFEELLSVARASREAGDHEAARESLRTALSFWRGPPLSGLEEVPFVPAQVARLEGARLAALEERLDADLATGRHASVVPELEALVQENPFRERMWAQLMLALYRSGSQAEALRVYGRLRSILADELGIDPAPATRALEQSILLQEPALDLPSPTRTDRASAGGRPAVPRPATLQDSGEPARATVTLLLTDIEGSSALWEQHEEAMDTALRRHDELVASVVSANGGTLVKQRGEGDSAFVVFQRPMDAMKAAAQLRSTLAAEPWPSVTPIRVRIAVATGETHTRDGDYLGSTVNRVARLRALARGEQVLVGATTALLTIDDLPGELRLVDLGLHKLRDHRRPEHVFELVDDRDSAAEVSASRDWSNLAWSLTSPGDRFVGREDELERLQSELSAVATGIRRVAVIGGEAGIGKTRLAGEVARRLHAGGALVLYGRCDADAIVPYQPFVQALTFYAQACPTSLLRSDLVRWGPALAPMFPEVVAAVGGGAERAGSPEAERFRMFEGLDRWLEAIASRSTVVLVIDDLHWADESSLLLLRHLVQSPVPASMLVLATYRDTAAEVPASLTDFLADLSRGSAVTRLALSGLKPEEIPAYLERVAGHVLGPGEHDMIEMLSRETAGNPLFLDELMRHLIDTGAIRREDGQWHGAAALALPQSIRDLVSQRLSRLSEPARQAIVAAAVVGPEFHCDVVSHVTDMERDACFEALEEAVRARLLEEALEEDRYIFRHDVVRHALYQGLSRHRRHQLHRQVALALEWLQLDDSDRRLNELAWHSCEGASTREDAERAARWAREAGDRAAAQLAFEAAADHYRRGLDVIQQRNGDLAVTIGLLLELGAVLNKSGRAADGQPVFVAAADHIRAIGRPDLLAEAALGYGGVLPAFADHMDDTGRALLEESLAQLPTAGTEGLRACLLARLAHWTYWQKPRPDRDHDCSQALELARASGDPATVAAVLNSCYWALDGPDDLDEQLWRGEEITRLGESLADREILLQGLKCRLHVLLTNGDFSDADQVAQASEQLAKEVRQPEYLRLGTTYRAFMAGVNGEWDEAERLAEANLATMQAARHPHVVTVYVAQVLPWRWLQGRAGELAALIESSLRFDPRRVISHCVLPWAYCDHDAGHARSLLDTVDPRWFTEREHDLDWLAICAMTAMAVESLGDAAWAERLYPALLPYADRNCTAGQSSFLGTMQHHLGSLALVAGDYDAAVTHLDRAADRHEQMSAWPFLALTRQARARALLGRRSSGDADEAGRMIDQAASAAKELQLGAVTIRLDRLLETQDRP